VFGISLLKKHPFLSVGLLILLMGAAWYFTSWGGWRSVDRGDQAFSKPEIGKHAFEKKPGIVRQEESQTKGTIEETRVVGSPPKSNYDYFYNGSRDGSKPYYLVGGNGRLTTGAAEAAGLSEEERRSVQSLVDAVSAAAEEDFLSRMVHEPARSDPEKGVTSYHIAASPDRGEKILGDFRSAMSAAIGPDRAAMLVRSFDVGSCVVGMGRKDVSLEVKVPLPGEGGITLIRYELADPESGRIGSSGESSIQPFKRRFGNILNFDGE